MKEDFASMESPELFDRFMRCGNAMNHYLALRKPKKHEIRSLEAYRAQREEIRKILIERKAFE